MGDIAEMYEDYAMEEMAKWEADQAEREHRVKQMEKDYMMGALKWGSIKGPIMVTQMTDLHIINCIEMIKKNDYANEEISHKWVELFEIELQKRK